MKEKTAQTRTTPMNEKTDMDEELEKSNDETDTGDNDGSSQGGIDEMVMSLSARVATWTRNDMDADDCVLLNGGTKKPHAMRAERAGEKDAASKEYSYSESEAVERKKAADLSMEDRRNKYAAKDEAYTEISQQHLNDKVNAMDEIGQHIS